MAGGMRMNDRQMKQAMKKMGIKQTSIDDVTEVIIRTKTNEIVIRGADVVCVEMGGSKSYQISGVETVRELGAAGEDVPAVTFASEDVELVMSQTGCDREKAVEALTATDGQPAEAILKIMSE
ncbi:MAG: nascent polypeptide-associated complex protein [Candidatus Methanomethylophilaceae archaeon]